MKRRNFLKVTGGASAALCLLTPQSLKAITEGNFTALENSFINPLKSDGPWVVWHWTSANQTKDGVTSNLEGMAEAGIAGATLFSFPPGQGFGGSTFVKNPAAPLTPEWFELVNHAVTEAGRLGIELAIQISAGWATAGGDWITPELSQQQIVWSEVKTVGGKRFNTQLKKPKKEHGVDLSRGGETEHESWKDYYRDLSVLAINEQEDWGKNNLSEKAKITTDLPVDDWDKIVDPENNEIVLTCEKKGYLQFEFDQPFTLRSIRIHSGGSGGFGSKYNLPAHSLEVQASDDGTNFKKIGNLEPMLSGWQTRTTELTHTIKETTSKFFRLVYHPAPPINYDEHMVGASYSGGGFEAATNINRGGVNLKEMIDALTLASVTLSSTAVVHHWQGKTALTWGRSRRITNEEMPEGACIPLENIIDLTELMSEDGSIDWQVPDGNWKIMRFGYTTMERTNGGGIGQGLEPDKFSREAARSAFNGWYGRILDHIGPRLANNVVKMLNIDSWECGSQNWSPVFKDEFKARRGYDVTKYLPLMAGIPIQNADVTEGFLFDIRRTIADLISDNFYGEIQKLAHARGSVVNTEVTNPTMTSDGMLAYKNVDQTSSEFWCDSWGCWKPCDIRDAASGAHVYGKKIVIAEAFTGGGDWKEHPYDLKAMGDMHFVDGINRMMLHLWAAQPYPGRVPGMTGAAGTYINEHTTWIKPGKAWIDYMRRAQSLLQTGVTVCDALYFIGEDVPCRALLPQNYGSYFTIDPALPEGYDYDSINQDALLNLASVKNGKIVLPGGVSYRVLVLHPDKLLTPAMAHKIRDLVAAGAQVLGTKPPGSPSLEMGDKANLEVLAIAEDLWGNMDGIHITERVYGSGRIFWGLSMEEVLVRVGVTPDVLFRDQKESLTGKPYAPTANQVEGVNATAYGSDRKGWGLMWNHRTNKGTDFYFLSNQEQLFISTNISIRQDGRIPEFWHPDTGLIEDVPVWKEENGRTIIPYEFEPSGSVFIMFRKSSSKVDQIVEINGNKGLELMVSDSDVEKWAAKNGQWSLITQSGKTINVSADSVPAPLMIEGEWDVTFPLLTGERKYVKLAPGSWTTNNDEDVKYFSGTATYHKILNLDSQQIAENRKLFLDLGDVKNLATIKMNGKNLGVVWKPPYKVEVTDAVIEGQNKIEVQITNTWFNRLTKDAGLPDDQKRTWVAGGGFRGGFNTEAPLEPAGLMGPISIKTYLKI